VKYWLHGAHLLAEGRKMSKSLGNFFTVRDLLSKGYTGREIRCLLLQAHYRETFNFTIEGLQGARAALTRIDECLLKLKELAAPQDAPGEPAKSPVIDAFTKALDDDLNISAAWGTVFDWVRDTNRRLIDGGLTPADARTALEIWGAMDSVLGVGPLPEPTAPPEMLALLEARQAARKSRDFKKADEIRNELKAKGWTIEDTPKGTRLKKKCEVRSAKDEGAG